MARTPEGQGDHFPHDSRLPPPANIPVTISLHFSSKLNCPPVSCKMNLALRMKRTPARLNVREEELPAPLQEEIVL